MSSKNRIWSWIPLETVHFITNVILLKFKNWWDYKYKNALLFIKKKFFETSKIQFLRERMTKKYSSISSRNFFTFSRIETAKDSWGFVPMLEWGGPIFVEENLKKKQRKNRCFWTTRKRNLNQLESKSSWS